MARAAPGQVPAAAPIAVGARVRVAARYPCTGHVRTPFYLRGKEGRVIRDYGVFLDPTALATGAAAPSPCRLYQVAFAYAEVWGGDGREAADRTRIVADLYDPWLETLP